MGILMNIQQCEQVPCSEITKLKCRKLKTVYSNQMVNRVFVTVLSNSSTMYIQTNVL